MKLETIGTKYMVAEGIFPNIGNTVNENFFFKDEKSAKDFYNKRIIKIREEISNNELFNGFATNDTAILDSVPDIFLICRESDQKGIYALQYIVTEK